MRYEIWVVVALSALSLVGCDGGTADERGDARPTGHAVDGSLLGPDAEPFAPPDGGLVDSGFAPLKLEFEPIAQDSNALRITDMAFFPAPSREFLLVDKDGEVVHMRLDGDSATRLGSFVVDDVWFDSDAGLLSVAIDPDFESNRFIYLGYSTSQSTNVVSRFTLDADDYAATAASRVLVIAVTGEGAPRSWHNVGSIGFTEEGYLWALFGDKVLDALAQDLNSPLGALLRIIPDRTAAGGYTVPGDNPYADGTGHPAVYAKGMRSPWTGIYRRGRWVFGDVGLETSEEINVISGPGQNFGWPGAEGPCEDRCEGLEDPWMAYGRSSRIPMIIEDPQSTGSRKRSVWIGWEYVPNGADPYQGRWDDVLTYGDFFIGAVRGRSTRGGASWHVGHYPMITAWDQGPDGYVYVAAIGTWPPDAPTAPSPLLRAVLAD